MKILTKIDKWIDEKLNGIDYKVKLLLIGLAYLVGITIRMVLSK